MTDRGASERDRPLHGRPGGERILVSAILATMPAMLVAGLWGATRRLSPPPSLGMVLGVATGVVAAFVAALIAVEAIRRQIRPKRVTAPVGSGRSAVASTVPARGESMPLPPMDELDLALLRSWTERPNAAPVATPADLFDAVRRRSIGQGIAEGRGGYPGGRAPGWTDYVADQRGALRVYDALVTAYGRPSGSVSDYFDSVRQCLPPDVRLVGGEGLAHVDAVGERLVYSLPAPGGTAGRLAFTLSQAQCEALLADRRRRLALEATALSLARHRAATGGELTEVAFSDLVRRVLHGVEPEVVATVAEETGDDVAARIDAAFSTTVLTTNRDWMFWVFRTGEGSHYMNVVAGGVALYEATIRLSADEAATLVADGDRAVAFARSVIRNPGAFEERRVRPSIDP